MNIKKKQVYGDNNVRTAHPLRTPKNHRKYPIGLIIIIIHCG